MTSTDEGAQQLPPIERPNGKLYRPRKVIAYGVYDADECPVGVVVFGTHDADRAGALAESFVKCDLLDSGYVPVNPSRVWWRDGFDGSARAWITDEEHGRAGVWFRELAEATS
jgi:hypothetical protein